MWAGILFVGVVMAVGTLLVLDAALPGGLIEGDGTVAYAQTMAFTTLMMFQLFNVFNARSDDRSAFAGLFANRWLWAALALSLGLQIAVVYIPVLQAAFSTVSLGPARLAGLRRRGEFGSLAAGAQQAPRPGAPRAASRPSQVFRPVGSIGWIGRGPALHHRHPLRPPEVTDSGGGIRRWARSRCPVAYSG